MHGHEAVDIDEIMELSATEHSVLGALFHKHACQPFSVMMTTTESAEEGLSGAEARLGFMRLRQKGWIEAVRKTWGENLYYIPLRYIPALTVAYANRVGKHPFLIHEQDQKESRTQMVSSDQTHVIREARPDIAAEIIHLLAWIAREGLTLTNKGTIHKRMLQRLSALTHLCPDDFAGLNLNYEHPDIYPVHVAIMLDLLLALGLLHKDQEKIRVHDETLSHWLEQPWSCMHREIFKVCMERYGVTSPAEQHFRYRLVLLGKGQETWFNISDLIPHFKGSGSDTGLPGYIQSWLNALAGWGYGESGENASGDLFFRWLVEPEELLPSKVQQELDSAKNVFFVQPDFEIMVPAEVVPQVRWKIEHCAELLSCDRMSIYRVTKEQIVNASHRGFTSDKVVEFLRRYAATGVPEHVYHAIQQWGNEWERLKAQRGGNAEKIQSIQPTDFICSEGSGEDKSTEIHKHEPRVGLSGLRESFYVHGRQGLIQNEPDRASSYTQGQPIVEQSDDLPAFGSIPDMWHNDWRRYHMSTTRQITAKAIEWQTKLGLRNEQSEVYIIPDQIQGQDDWTLTGWIVPGADERTIERCTISPMDWDKIRLIVPEQI